MLQSSQQQGGSTMDINEYYKQMLPDDIIMSYKGAPSEELLNSILSIADIKLASIEQQGKLKKKVYHILIEVIQNIHHHYDLDDREAADDGGSIIFILARVAGGYLILTGNYVPSSNVGTLKKHLEVINNLSADELKEHYRRQLNQGNFSEKGGAGLGILDIARRSGERLDYEFKDMRNGNSFFSLKVKVSA